MDLIRTAISRRLKSLTPWRLWLAKGDAPMPSLAKARELLVIRLDEIGDFVLTSAFLRELRRNAPLARITLVANHAVLTLANNCPYVNEVIAFDQERPGHRLWRVLRRRVRAFRMRLKTFRGRKFDLVLLPRRGTDIYAEQFLAHLWAGSAAIAACRDELVAPSNSSEHAFTTAHYFDNPRVEHEVHHALSFLRWCGGNPESDKLEVWPAQSEWTFARDLLEKHFSRKGPLIILHPSGGREVLKQWPADRFQTLLKEMQNKMAVECLVVGGADEPWIGELFPSSQARGVLNVAGQLGLGQLAAIIAAADLFIGCDSGPMHLAAATGVPVLAIFGPTSQIRFHPHSPQAVEYVVL